MNKTDKVTTILNDFRGVEVISGISHNKHNRKQIYVLFETDSPPFLTMLANIANQFGFVVSLDTEDGDSYCYKLIMFKDQFSMIMKILEKIQSENPLSCENVIDSRKLHLVKMLRKNYAYGGFEKDGNEILEDLFVCKNCGKEVYTHESFDRLIRESGGVNEAYHQIHLDRCCQHAYYEDDLEERKDEYAQYLSNRLFNAGLIPIEKLMELTTEEILASYRICNNCGEELYSTEQQNMAIMEFESADKTFEVLGEILDEHGKEHS